MAFVFRPGGVPMRRLARRLLLAVGFIAATLVAATASPSCPSLPLLGPPEALLQTAGKIARGAPLKILAIGSSSTQGVGASGPDHAYPARLEAMLNARLGAGAADVVNAGIGGETAADTLARLRKLVGETRFDLVIWQAGTNDAVRGDDMAAFRTRIEAGIRGATERGSDVMLLDQQFFPKVKDPVRYERFVEALDEIGVDNGVAVFRRYGAMRQWAAQQPDYERAMLAEDRFHMSDRGYDCLAAGITDQLLALKAAPAIASGPRQRVPARPASPPVP